VSDRADIAVIGGGVMGSALAYWLTRLEPTASVVVVERDPTYASASSALSAASIRQQFTSAVNVRISQASIDFLRQADGLLEVDGIRPDIGLCERGYLYLATNAGLPALREAHRIQSALGAQVARLDKGELERRFPWLNTADLVGGSLGLNGEGWFDGYQLLTALIRKARSQGARYQRGEVIGLDLDNERVEALRLAGGSRLECRYAVNAAGPWARVIAGYVGLDLPVAARRRTVYVLTCPHRLEGLPLLIDPSGFWIRPEGAGFIAGLPPPEDPDDAPLEPDYATFDSTLWPALAHRIPAFEQARLERAWAGYYEMNLFDHNGLVGPHPRIANFLLMNGFSGHGLQQAPCVGRALAELILHGRYLSVDLSPLDFGRVQRGEPLRELNVI